MFRSSNTNVAARIFERQIRTPAPGTSIHRARQFYENIVPNFTVYDLECPDHSFRKFTDDGRYLISFSRTHQDLVVYRPTWLSYSCNREDCDSADLPPEATNFTSYFTQLYSVQLASDSEFICKDFFLYVEGYRFGVFATSTTHVHDIPASEGSVQGVPSVEKITFHVVRLEDGVKLDERVFYNDYINLAHSAGAFMYDDLLAIVSLRFQKIYILQVRDTGNLVNVRAIGQFCREDDELFISSNHQVPADGNVPQEILSLSESSFLSGFKQRLLSFIFRGMWAEEPDETLRIQCLKKKFYYHFQDYVDLVMWKAQFLDRRHLLIKLGSVDGAVARNADQQTAFFAVYNMETTDVIAFYQSSAEELYFLWEHFFDHFQVASNSSLNMNFISSPSNNIHALEQLKSSRNNSGNFPQFVRKMLTSLPFNCQTQSPSPYFDQSLFRYDEKLISSADRCRQCTDHPIKFTLRRKPHILKFKIRPGPENGGNTDSRGGKKIWSFLFHPSLPLALSIQQTFFQHPSVVNIHFRR